MMPFPIVAVITIALNVMVIEGPPFGYLSAFSIWVIGTICGLLIAYCMDRLMVK